MHTYKILPRKCTVHSVHCTYRCVPTTRPHLWNTVYRKFRLRLISTSSAQVLIFRRRTYNIRITKILPRKWTLLTLDVYHRLQVVLEHSVEYIEHVRPYRVLPRKILLRLVGLHQRLAQAGPNKTNAQLEILPSQSTLLFTGLHHLSPIELVHSLTCIEQIHMYKVLPRKFTHLHASLQEKRQSKTRSLMCVGT